VTTDTREKGLETLIMRHMTGEDGMAVLPEVAAGKLPPFGGAGYIAGSAKGFDRARGRRAAALCVSACYPA
jgi:type I restriction enzyme, R subunit